MSKVQTTSTLLAGRTVVEMSVKHERDVKAEKCCCQQDAPEVYAQRRSECSKLGRAFEDPDAHEGHEHHCTVHVAAAPLWLPRMQCGVAPKRK
eukprot:2721394-Pleurochrysis_carterae.AAC.1